MKSSSSSSLHTAHSTHSSASNHPAKGSPGPARARWVRNPLPDYWALPSASGRAGRACGHCTQTALGWGSAVPSGLGFFVCETGVMTPSPSETTLRIR